MANWARLYLADDSSGLDMVNPAARGIRFWYWSKNSVVKLVLHPGQVIETGRSGRHDEGWSSSSERLYFDGVKVWRDWWSDGTDCDGRMSASGQDVMVDPVGHEHHGLRLPTWERVESGQRDYAAEAAGY